MSVGEAVRSPQFIILLLTNFFCCATHSGPIIHTVSYAVSCGIPLIAAVSIYSLEGFAGLVGRIGFGLLGDKFGAKRVLVAGLLVQAFGALAYVFVRDLGASMPWRRCSALSMPAPCRSMLRSRARIFR